jgi:uncharacterized protein (TIGR02453 family)
MLQVTTLNFLQGISQHNNREWFLEHKPEFEQAKQDVHQFAAALIAGLAQLDPLIPSNLDPKSCVMRIYRDVRFSKDKTPYKENFAIAISPKGKNFDGPGYYLHIHPEDSFVAGGYWMPQPDELKAIRQEIDYNEAELRAVLQKPLFKKYFTSLDTSEKLKTVPKGYKAEHPAIELLKLKSFTAHYAISPAALCSATAVKDVLAVWNEIYPLSVFLRNALS